LCLFLKQESGFSANPHDCREREREREREDVGGSIKRRELHKIRGRSYEIHVLSSKYFAHPYRFIRSMQVSRLPVKDVPP